MIQPSSLKRKRPQQHGHKRRVILLLDLDCFYAQCECVRLGLNVIETSLALLQWDSVLAVTYPARKLFDVKRGDSWDSIKQKVKKYNEDHNENKNCYCISVPILTTRDAAEPSTENDPYAKNEEIGGDNTDALCNKVECDETTNIVKNEYDEIFLQSKSDQEVALKLESGVRKYSTEGKASIERYRIASRRIFETVLGWIDEHYKSDEIILERASIDEFFLDVTKACSDDGSSFVKDHDLQEALDQTLIVGKKESNEESFRDYNDNVDEDFDPQSQRSIQLGCWIGHQIRKRVYNKLGFTLSAGVSCNKTIAKLTTSYGKPNGQAVTYDSAIEYILNDTQIKKCRNLGGKLGKKVIALLPTDVTPTVGAIAKYLSLTDLQRGLADEDGENPKWIYDLSRGIDHEQVLSKNESAIPKSITCFKALPFHKLGYSIDDAAKWIQLLAEELISRVDRDTKRHNRYPRSCNVQYNLKQASTSKNRHQPDKSIRFTFPSSKLLTSQAKIEALMETVPQIIRNKEGNNLYRLTRIGLCAIDFVSQVSNCNSINSYFLAAPTRKTEGQPTNTLQPIVLADNDLYTTYTQKPTTCTVPIKTAPLNSGDYSPSVAAKTSMVQVSPSVPDSDLEYAKMLQIELNGIDDDVQCVDPQHLVQSKKKQVASDDDHDIEFGSVMPSEGSSSADDIHNYGNAQSHTVDSVKKSAATSTADFHQEDIDLVLAKKLQAKYDSENRLLDAIDMKHKSKSKIRRIDTFFQKK